MDQTTKFAMETIGGLPPVEDPPPYSAKGQNIYPATKTTSISSCEGIAQVSSPGKWRMTTIIIGTVLAVITIGAIIGIVILLTGNDDPVTTTANPESTTPISGWGPWTEWSDCDASCGLGSKTRSRECHPPPDLCVGTDSQVTNCYEQDCPSIEIGEWSHWGSYSPCTVTCGGGTQARNRTCVKSSPDALNCIGSDGSSKSCNNFGCPSCDRICPSGGTISPPCERCVCTGSVFNGKVVATNNLPVSNVQVADIELPTVILATSDGEGKFTIDNACTFTELLLTTDGYSHSVYFIIATGPTFVKIAIEKIQFLQMSEEPTDKMRLVGEAVTFCCSASGKPGPSYYEWYFNNELIDPVKYNYSNTLAISSVSAENCGNYKCRASNDYSAVFSEVAILNIKDKPEDYCPSYPDTHFVELPLGCTYLGERIFNLGKCSSAPCRGANETDSGTCSEMSLFCCGASEYGYFTATCPGYTVDVKYISKCGTCFQCTQSNVVIKGTVIDTSDKTPIAYASISVNGSEITRADTTGLFDFEVSLNTRQLVLQVKDIYNTYMETNKPIFISKGFTGIQYVYIKMHKKGPKQPGKSNEDNIFSIGSGKSSFAQIFIPGNVMYTANGDEYNGDFNAIINQIDPRNISEFTSLPSNLLFRDNLGITQRLESYGMYALSLESNNGTLLQVKGKIEVAIDSSMFGPGIDLVVPKLWALDPVSGLWKESSDLVPENETYPAWKKHKAFTKYKNPVMIGDIEYDIDMTWGNFDSNSDLACHSKVRAFKDNTFNEADQLRGVDFTFIALNKQTGSIESASIRSFSDRDKNTDDNGYCMVHTCDWHVDNKYEYEGYIISEASIQNGEPPQRLIPATYPELLDLGFPDDSLGDLAYETVIDNEGGNHAAFSKFDYTESPDGPFYKWDGYDAGIKDWAYSKKCTEAGSDEPYFAFYGYNQETGQCQPPVYNNEKVEVGGEAKDNCLAWFPTSLGNKYEVCYIKTLVTNWQNKEVQALSLAGNSTCDSLVNPGDTFGVTYACPTEDAPVCLEIKRGGEITDGLDTFDCETHIKVGPVISDGTPGSCGITAVTDRLINGYGDKIISKIGDDTFEMFLADSEFGTDFGIFCILKDENAASNMENARATAKANCEGTGNDIWAMKFDCQ